MRAVFKGRFVYFLNTLWNTIVRDVWNFKERLPVIGNDGTVFIIQVSIDDRVLLSGRTPRQQERASPHHRLLGVVVRPFLMKFFVISFNKNR
jgi:hypothetical protein